LGSDIKSKRAGNRQTRSIIWKRVVQKGNHITGGVFTVARGGRGFLNKGKKKNQDAPGRGKGLPRPTRKRF